MKANLKMRFLVGIVAVIFLCGSLFVYLDYTMSRVNSREAQLSSDTYTVGIDYSGIIEEQYVEEASFIKTGDPLFKLRSSTLTDAIRNNEVAKTSLLYSVDTDGLVQITAAAPGQIQSIEFREGAFVPANSQIATVNIENKLYVSATYKLSSPDYARLGRNSKIVIRFPDNRSVKGTVYDIELKTVGKETLTTVRARFDVTSINNTAFSVGTPLDTTLYLDKDTWFNRISTNVSNLLNPKSQNR